MAKGVLAELKLLLECSVQFLKVFELLRIAGLGSDLLLGAGIEAIVHCQLDNLSQVRLPSTGCPVS